MEGSTFVPDSPSDPQIDHGTYHNLSHLNWRERYAASSAVTIINTAHIIEICYSTGHSTEAEGTIVARVGHPWIALLVAAAILITVLWLLLKSKHKKGTKLHDVIIIFLMLRKRTCMCIISQLTPATRCIQLFCHVLRVRCVGLPPTFYVSKLTLYPCCFCFLEMLKLTQGLVSYRSLILVLIIIIIMHDFACHFNNSI